MTHHRITKGMRVHVPSLKQTFIVEAVDDATPGQVKLTLGEPTATPLYYFHRRP